MEVNICFFLLVISVFFILFFLDIDFEEEGEGKVLFCKGGLLFIIDICVDFVIFGLIGFFFVDLMEDSFFISFLTFFLL